MGHHFSIDEVLELLDPLVSVCVVFYYMMRLVLPNKTQTHVMVMLRLTLSEQLLPFNAVCYYLEVPSVDTYLKMRFEESEVKGEAKSILYLLSEVDKVFVINNQVI